MKKFFLKYKVALIVFVLILVGFWAYSTYFEQAKVVFEKVDEPVGEELFETLAVLRGISLDGDIFSNPDFLTLQDFETEVPAGRAGRANPFAQTGGDTGGVIVEPTHKVIPISPAETFTDTGSATSSTDSTTDVATSTQVTQ